MRAFRSNALARDTHFLGRTWMWSKIFLEIFFLDFKTHSTLSWMISEPKVDQEKIHFSALPSLFIWPNFIEHSLMIFAKIRSQFFKTGKWVMKTKNLIWGWSTRFFRYTMRHRSDITFSCSSFVETLLMVIPDVKLSK